MQRRTSRAGVRLAGLVLAIVLASGACAAKLPPLHGIEDVRDWFNAGRGHVRLILLLSPT